MEPQCHSVCEISGARSCAQGAKLTNNPAVS